MNGSATPESALRCLRHAQAKVPLVELLDQLGIELERVELYGVRHADEIREPQEQEEISFAQVFAMNGGPIRSNIDPLVDISRRPEPAVQAAKHRTQVVAG